MSCRFATVNYLWLRIADSQMIRITVEHAALHCEPGYLVLHVEHFISPADSSVWLLLEVWFPRKPGGCCDITSPLPPLCCLNFVLLPDITLISRNRSRFVSRKLSAPVVPIPAEIGAGISSISLRRYVESFEQCKLFAEAHEYAVLFT